MIIIFHNNIMDDQIAAMYFIKHLGTSRCYGIVTVFSAEPGKLGCTDGIG